jgi:hypothetical protein
MTDYDYNVAASGFIADLITKILAEGWVRAEAGYDWFKPSGYNCVLNIPALVYGGLYRNETSTRNYTNFKPILRASYDQPSHIGVGNGGSVYGGLVIAYNSNWTASANLVYVKGWIDSKNIILFIESDSGQAGGGESCLFVCIEAQAVDALANTIMLLDSLPIGLNYAGVLNPPSTAYGYICSCCFIHVLGDSFGYHPMMLGMGVGTASKVRVTSIYIARKDASSYKTQNLMYSIPYIHATYGESLPSEVAGDTFTIGGVTYKLRSTKYGAQVEYQSATYIVGCIVLVWIPTASTSGIYAKSYFRFWIRSA